MAALTLRGTGLRRSRTAWASVLTTNCRWLYGRGRESDGDNALQRLMDCDEMNEQFKVSKGAIMDSIALEREQTKTLAPVTLFTGDGSPTKNVRRIWYNDLYRNCCVCIQLTDHTPQD